MSTFERGLVIQMFDAVFNRRDRAACDEFFAGDYVEHAVAPFEVEAPGAVNGPEHMRNVVAWLTAQHPDIRMTVEEVVSDGDLVVARVLSQGTNLGRLNGVIPPTGKYFSVIQNHWYRVKDDKFVEHWAVRDDLAMMLQLCVLERPGPPA